MFFIETAKKIFAPVADTPLAPEERFHFVNDNRAATVQTNMSNYRTALRVVKVAREIAMDYFMGRSNAQEYQLALNVLEVAAESRSVAVKKEALASFAEITELCRYQTAIEPALKYYAGRYNIA